MKLEKSVVANRVKLLEEHGVRFRLGCDVGTDLPTGALMEDFDAVVLCIGARKARALEAPGADALGVHQAVDYLTAATRHLLGGAPVPVSLNAHGKDVVVVGGGDTGTDCVATAIRQGAKSVAAIEIMPALPETRAESNPWPLWPRVRKTDYGHEEALAVFGRDVREYETTVTEVLSKKGAVTGVATAKVLWEKDRAGRMAPKALPETLCTRDAGLVLLAMGFTGVESGLCGQMQLAMNPNGTVQTTEGDSTGKGGFATHLPGVFAAGDMRRGPSLVVWAIQEGMRAAAECHSYLQKLK
jgi:glutamate synthase (NADPH/NADH) small chain